ENVSPAEREAVLAGHPALADVAVIGVPDDRWGETVHAIVVLAPGSAAVGSAAAGSAATGSGATGSAATGNGDAGPGFGGAAGFDRDALVSWARERMAGFKCLNGVTVDTEIPRNARGKGLQHELRAPIWTDGDRHVAGRCHSRRA